MGTGSLFANVVVFDGEYAFFNMNAYGRDSLLNLNFVNEADILCSLTLIPEGNGYPSWKNACTQQATYCNPEDADQS